MKQYFYFLSLLLNLVLFFCFFNLMIYVVTSECQHTLHFHMGFRDQIQVLVFVKASALPAELSCPCVVFKLI